VLAHFFERKVYIFFFQNKNAIQGLGVCMSERGPGSAQCLNGF
jgi:hypothetical protein